jgi:hypothetical protein
MGQIAWGTGEFLMMDTDLKESGKSVRLELVLRKPACRGPFPIFVMNHGSTGTGANPKVFRQTWSAPSLAPWLSFCRSGLDGCLSAAAGAR